MPVSQEQQQQQQQQFARDGYLVCRQAVPRPAVTAWSERYGSSHFFNDVFAQLYRHGRTPFPQHCRRRRDNDNDTAIELEYALGRGVRHGFDEIVMRSPGRYEIAIPESDPARLDLLDTIRHCVPWVPQLLLPMPAAPDNVDNEDDTATPSCSTPSTFSPTWDQVRIINVSVVVSTPGAPAQGWHADGGHVDLHQHQPCHCLAVFVPLIDIPTIEWGPTQLRPGSHVHTRNLVPLMLAAQARRTWRPPVAPLLQRGDALILDYRLLHRGLAHHASSTTPSSSTTAAAAACAAQSQHRPILVVTVAQPWFRDVVNVPSRSLYDAAVAGPARRTSKG